MSDTKKAIQNVIDKIQIEGGRTRTPVENIEGVVEATVSSQKGKARKTVERGLDQIERKRLEKEKRIRDFRREASRLASIANKRVQRLEKNNFTDSPAYKAYIETGGKFGVRGKTFNEVQAEVARLRTFLNAKTSTIRGVNQYLKEIASNTGIEYSSLTELKSKASKFFELSSKVEQYLRTVEDMASAIGYQKIWEAINVYVKENSIDLSQANTDIDGLIVKVSDALTEYEKPENILLREGNLISGGKPTKSSWFKLKKD